MRTTKGYLEEITMVTAESLFGMSKEEYLQGFIGDEDEAGKAYDTYIERYKQFAICVNAADVAGLRALATKYNMSREDLDDFIDAIE